MAGARKPRSGTARTARWWPSGIAAVLMLALSPTAVRAAMPVIDAAHIAKTAMVYAAEQDQLQELFAQHRQLLEAYALQSQQYEQLFVNLRNIPNPMPALGGGFVHLDVAQLAEAQCGGPGSAPGIGGALSLLLSAGTPLAESQRTLCQQVVALQVTKYNETTDMLARLDDYARIARETEDQRLGIANASGNGDLAGNSNQVHRNAAQLAVEMDNWRGRMAAYDAQLQALRDAQGMLAQVALRGQSPSLLGTSVQALALRTALQLNP